MHRPPPHNNSSNEGLLVQATVVVAMGANICGVICSLIKVQLILKPLATAATTTTATTAAGQIQVKYEFSVFWTKSEPTQCLKTTMLVDQSIVHLKAFPQLPTEML